MPKSKKFGIFNGRTAQEVEMRHPAKFGPNRSKHGRDISIFQFSKMAVATALPVITKCRRSLLPMRAKFGVLEQTHDIRLQAKFSSPLVYSVALWQRKPPNFAVFGLRHFVVSPVGSISLRNLNTGAQLQTFPYPTASKSFLYSNCFCTPSWQSWALNL